MAIRTGLLDVPNERSSHQRPTPLIGGVAIYLAVGAAYSIPAAIGLVPINRVFASFFVAGLILVSVGLMDDYIRLSTLGKFAAQIIASLLMIYGGGVVLTDLGAMTFSGTTVELGWFSVPFTVFATLGVINALNMSDGLDGLSGTLSLISLTGLMIAAIFGGAFSEAFILVLLAASIFGFLLFNFRVPGRKRAAVFMGDAGSMFIGFSLTWFAIALAQGPDRVMTPAAALWFLMLPIFDTVAMMFRRIIRRRSPPNNSPPVTFCARQRARSPHFSNGRFRCQRDRGNHGCGGFNWRRHRIAEHGPAGPRGFGSRSVRRCRAFLHVDDFTSLESHAFH
jgi:UDP-GlcNAc:undecaprenyl-phosphate GlcNAc-1-phosphate transferase